MAAAGRGFRLVGPRPGTGRSWAVLAALMLGACAVDGQAPVPPAVGAAFPAPAPATAKAETTPRPSAAPGGAAAVADSAAKPLALVGMDDRAVIEALGQPSLKRREQPAQYWLYSDHGCTLGLFLYLDRETGKSRVAYYELHRPDRPQLVADTCGPTLARLAPMGADTGRSELVAH